MDNDTIDRMNENQGNRIIGLVGERGSGKTSLILDLLQNLQNQDLQIAGIISPGIFEGDRKIAIEMIELKSRQGRLLAVLRNENETGVQFGDWSFFEETLNWANQRLQAISSCDILILDEIGPLELDFNQGLQQGLNKMVAGEYKLGLVSLRPKCTESIQHFFPQVELFFLDALGQQVIKDTILRIVNNIY